MGRKREAQTGGAGYYKDFPTRLRGLLKDTKTTQAALAEHLGIARQSVAAYCSGESTPSWEGIVKIARRFSCSADYLLGITDEPNESAPPVSLVSAALSREEADALKTLIEEKISQWAEGQEVNPEQTKALTRIYLRL